MISFNRKSFWWTISSEVMRYDEVIIDTEQGVIRARNSMYRKMHRVTRLKMFRKQAFEEMLQMQAWEDDGGPSFG